MHDNPVALVTGANQGVGLQVAKELVANGHTVLLGSRSLGLIRKQVLGLTACLVA